MPVIQPRLIFNPDTQRHVIINPDNRPVPSAWRRRVAPGGGDFLAQRSGGGADTPSNDAIFQVDIPAQAPVERVDIPARVWGSYRTQEKTPETAENSNGLAPPTEPVLGPGPEPPKSKSKRKPRKVNPSPVKSKTHVAARAPSPNYNPDDPDEPFDVDIDIPITSPLNGGHSTHAAIAARRKRERIATEQALALADDERERIRSWPQAYITLERIGAAPMDGDNLQAGFKSVRDEVARWLGRDDADASLLWRYRQRVQRVRDPSAPPGKTRWKSYCRVVIGPNPEVAAKESPDFEPYRVETSSKSTRPVAQDVFHGSILAERALPPRLPKNSHLRVARMKIREGPKAGEHYLRVATHWNTRHGEPYRTQGIGVRLEEVDELIAALVALRDDQTDAT